jgi:O-antigen polymerase
MVSKNTINILLVFPLAATLFNSEILGAVTLISFLLYAIFASIAAAVLSSSALVTSQSYFYRPTPYTWVFLILVTYIFAHGLLTDTANTNHYYWLANGIYFITVHFWNNATVINSATGSPRVSTTSYADKTIILYTGISILAFAESVVVILQYAQLLPRINEYHPASGTWINPNVTAMFIALGVFAVLKVKASIIKPLHKILITAVLFVALAAVLLLKCRSAYLAVIILLLAENAPSIKKIRLNVRTALLGLALLVLGVFMCFVFVSKKKSAFNRIKIWENTLELASSAPPAGYGFGRFEREYNVFAAQQMNKENDHINMPYNDFLELWVEGGVAAMILWTAFLVLAFHYFFKARYTGSQSIIIAFIAIQLTNFGFQAIPVTALFLLYMAMGGNAEQAHGVRLQQETPAKGHPKWHQYTFTGVTVLLALISFGLLYKAVNLTGLLYRNEAARKSSKTLPVMGIYKQLATQLDGNSLFHENYGDALMDEKEHEEAKLQFIKALKVSSREELFAKTGYCFQKLGKYDSSEYYYKVLENMTPHKFNPKFWFLKLYEQKKDSAMLYRKANEIINMPIKVEGERVQFIKNYALGILDSLSISRK